MGIIEIFLIALGLAMDAFAVAICKGLSMQRINLKKSAAIALWFGGFQATMPIIGWLFGNIFKGMIASINHLIAFALLLFIGIKMLKDGFKTSNEKVDENISFKTMLPLALATSIDALTVGVTLSFFDTNIVLSAGIIGIVTFVLSYIGVKMGNMFGTKYERKAQVIGGSILICLGIKNLLDYFS